MNSAPVTSGSAPRMLIMTVAGLLGITVLLASCSLIPTGTAVHLQATPRVNAGESEHAPDPQNTTTATPAQVPIQVPNVVGSISCPPLPAASVTGVDRFLTCEYESGSGQQMTFYLYVPNGYDPSKSYPMVLILHGDGESANPMKTPAENRANILKQEYISVWGPGSPAGGPSVQSQFPCFVIVPQAVGTARWVDGPGDVTSYQLTAQPTLSLQMAIDSTVLVEQQYSSIDANRLYITGISMGAYGVWDSILRWPSLFAAAVPVSGAGDPALAKRIADMPIWDFHGADDNVVPVAGSRLMIRALQAAGSQPCYTQFPGQLHVIWDLVYGLESNPNNQLYPWLFSQVKNSQTVAFECH